MKDLSADQMNGRSDEIYAALIEAHEGLNDQESMALNARLILLLANATGDPDLVLAAIEAAKPR